MEEESANLPALSETKETRPTTRAGRAAAVKPWKTSKRVKRRFREALSSKELYASIKKIIADPKNPHFVRVLELMLEYAEIPKVDPRVDDDEGESEALQPTALPPVVRTKETVTRIYDEGGNLVKVFGKKELKMGKGATAPAANEDIVDGDYHIEE